MKIAVTYENGEVFQHFGKTENFKVYETFNDKIISGKVIPTNGAGHEALADFLAEQGVNAVICGGLGDGAQAARASVGIEVCSGASGDADAAADAFLRGELVSTGANCDHHHEHEEEEEHCCTGQCHSCGGCHALPDIEGPNVGKTCRTHYIGTLDDGTQFDSSYDRGEPLEFICGAGMMIRGFDEAVATMEVGQITEVRLTPDEAYGYPDPCMVFSIEIEKLPGSENLQGGERVVLYDNMGNPTPVTVVARDEKTITFDANHELAGKALNFRIELVEVK